MGEAANEDGRPSCSPARPSSALKCLPPSSTSTSRKRQRFIFTDLSACPSIIRPSHYPSNPWSKVLRGLSCPNDDLGVRFKLPRRHTAFSDPTFYQHAGVCNNPSLGELYPSGVETMYTWDTLGGYAPLCQYTPSCLACPALLNCADGSNDGCACNGDLDSNGKGECNSFNEGGPFCYVDSDSTCGHVRAQYFLVWGGDSGLRYLSNEACDTTTDLSGYARNS